MTLISVVIPTYRRPQLVVRAVRSVLAQTYSAIEILVVIDGVDDGTREVLGRLDDSRVQVLETGINRGPAEARNFGIRAASGSLIATLDDDDEWMPNKLAVQIKLIKEAKLTGDFIVACRSECRSADGVSVVTPDLLYRTGEDLGEYLFNRRTPISRPGFVPSGTYLFPRSLGLRIPFPSDDAHEEMGWLLNCVSGARVPLVMAEEPLFIYHLQPATRNHTQSWRASLSFARKYSRYMTPCAFSGLLSTTTAWRAKRQGGSRALIEIGRAMAQEGDCRLVHWMTLAGITLLPLWFINGWRRRRA